MSSTHVTCVIPIPILKVTAVPVPVITILPQTRTRNLMISIVSIAIQLVNCGWPEIAISKVVFNHILADLIEINMIRLF